MSVLTEEETTEMMLRIQMRQLTLVFAFFKRRGAER